MQGRALSDCPYINVSRLARHEATRAPDTENYFVSGAEESLASSKFLLRFSRVLRQLRHSPLKTDSFFD